MVQLDNAGDDGACACEHRLQGSEAGALFLQASERLLPPERRALTRRPLCVIGSGIRPPELLGRELATVASASHRAVHGVGRARAEVDDEGGRVLRPARAGGKLISAIRVSERAPAEEDVRMVVALVASGIRQMQRRRVRQVQVGQGPADLPKQLPPVAVEFVGKGDDDRGVDVGVLPPGGQLQLLECGEQRGDVVWALRNVADDPVAVELASTLTEDVTDGADDLSARVGPLVPAMASKSARRELEMKGGGAARRARKVDGVLETQRLLEHPQPHASGALSPLGRGSAAYRIALLLSLRAADRPSDGPSINFAITRLPIGLRGALLVRAVECERFCQASRIGCATVNCPLGHAFLPSFARELWGRVVLFARARKTELIIARPITSTISLLLVRRSSGASVTRLGFVAAQDVSGEGGGFACETTPKFND